MKLLFDQNLSFKLAAQLSAHFPDSKHVKDFGLAAAEDEIIWKFAREGGYAIVSKDSDFLNRSFLRGHPPKVIQLRVGNCATAQIFDLLLREREVIAQFLQNPEESLLVIALT